MRKEIEYINPTSLHQILQRYMTMIRVLSPDSGVYSFGIDGQQVYIYINKYDDLVVDFGNMGSNPIGLGMLHTLEEIETILHREELLSKINVVVVRAKMLKWDHPR